MLNYSLEEYEWFQRKTITAIWFATTIILLRLLTLASSLHAAIYISLVGVIVTKISGSHQEVKDLWSKLLSSKP
jgi:MFS-type transporter involved in bile tolerance (Atg22 family)